MSRRASAQIDHADPVEPSPEAAGAPAGDPGAALPLATRVEAILIAADRPVTIARLREALGLDADANDSLQRAVEELNHLYDQTERAFRIEPVAGGFRIMTRAAYVGDVAAIRGLRDAHRLSRPALETLAIIAYRQPMTRAQIESIRGVACGEVLKTLLDARLVAITGRAEELGRPMLYATTRTFLETFGLASLKDLPPVDAAAEKAIPAFAASRAENSDDDGASNTEQASDEPGAADDASED